MPHSLPPSPTPPPASGPAASRGWRRLLTPGMAWLVLGVLAGLVGFFLLGWLDPKAPNWSKGTGQALSSLGIWLGCLSLAGAGLGAVVQGLIQLAAADRAERQSSVEAVAPAVGGNERVVGRLLVVVLSLFGGIAVLGGAAASPIRDQVSLLLLGVGGGLIVFAIVAAVPLALAFRRLNETPTGSADWTRTANAGLDRPVPHLHVGWLVLLVVVAVALQLTLVKWIVEDAAISFAYARNLADGEGLVTYAGGERVEGFSNPLWTFLLAAFYAIGIDGFVSNKIMGVVFGALTVPMTWAIAREARPHRADAVPVLAAALLAVSAQFAIWSAGGLENSLLNVLLALAIWRGLVEGRTGGTPWSALAWVGVAMTRPEGIMYAAIGGFWSLVFRATRPGVGLGNALTNPKRLPSALWRAFSPTLGWLAMFFIPFGLYQAWRYSYFAWELPNTYYAKKGNPGKSFDPFSWTRKGWKYVRGWSHSLGQGYLVPVYVVGLLGTRGIRGSLAIVACVALATVLLVPGPDWLLSALDVKPRLPDWWTVSRVWVLVVVTGVTVLATIGRRGWSALVLCASIAASAVFFSIYAGGDWMGGYRWFATWVVPGAVLVAVGLGELADRAVAIDRRVAWVGVAVGGVSAIGAAVFGTWLQIPPIAKIPALGLHVRPISGWVLLGGAAVVIVGIIAGFFAQRARGQDVRWGPFAWTVALAGLTFVAVPSLSHLDRFWGKPTTSPWKVKKRVDYMNWVQAHLHLDERPTTLDVDMGATMYWSDDRIIDIAGLVDVPMAHRWFDKPFVGEYIFNEVRPTFAHVHGGWASSSGLTRFGEWDEQYLEIPPYPTSKRSQHTGNHVRKDLFVQPQWHGPQGRQVRYDRGLTLAGWDVVAGEGAPGRHLYVEIGWMAAQDLRKGEDMRVLLFLAGADGVLHMFDAPPGYDWYPPREWDVGEVVIGRHSVPLPADLPMGTYDFGVVVIADPQGQAMAPVAIPDGATSAPESARVARTEVVWASAVEIVGVQTLEQHAQEDLDAVASEAAVGRCEAAEDGWRLARRRMTRTWFDETHEARITTLLAQCWAARATQTEDRAEVLDALVRARAWNHRAPEVMAAATPWADEWMQLGLRAREDRNWAEAYPHFRDVLRVDPYRAWVRRYAVEARDCKLGIRLDNHDCNGGAATEPPAPTPSKRVFTPLRNRTPRLPVLPVPAIDTDDGGADSP